MPRILPAIALLAATATPALADLKPDRLSFLLGSHHISPSQTFEEFNPGVFLTWEGTFDTNLGLYRNSYGRTAAAATLAFPFYESGTFTLSAFVGAAYYPDDGRRFRVHAGDFIPLGGLQARIGPTFVQFIPGDGREVDGIVAFGLTFPLDRR